MLTEHEQLADHEARISRQELPPLQQPLDNIEEIRQALSHEWQPFDSAPDGVKLLWYVPRTASENGEINCTPHYAVRNKGFVEIAWDIVDREECKWQHLPPPPKDKNV